MGFLSDANTFVGSRSSWLRLHGEDGLNLIADSFFVYVEEETTRRFDTARITSLLRLVANDSKSSVVRQGVTAASPANPIAEKTSYPKNKRNKVLEW